MKKLSLEKPQKSSISSRNTSEPNSTELVSNSTLETPSTEQASNITPSSPVSQSYSASCDSKSPALNPDNISKDKTPEETRPPPSPCGSDQNGVDLANSPPHIVFIEQNPASERLVALESIEPELLGLCFEILERIFYIYFIYKILSDKKMNQIQF